MEILLVLIAIVVQGLVVGALGRLAIPGPNPMSIGQTILIGVAGSFVGGLVGYFVFGNNFGFLLGILTAALIVWLVERRRSAPAM